MGRTKNRLPMPYKDGIPLGGYASRSRVVPNTPLPNTQVPSVTVTSEIPATPPPRFTSLLNHQLRSPRVMDTVSPLSHLPHSSPYLPEHRETTDLNQSPVPVHAKRLREVLARAAQKVNIQPPNASPTEPYQLNLLPMTKNGNSLAPKMEAQERPWLSDLSDEEDEEWVRHGKKTRRHFAGDSRAGSTPTASSLLPPLPYALHTKTSKGYFKNFSTEGLDVSDKLNFGDLVAMQNTDADNDQSKSQAVRNTPLYSNVDRPLSSSLTANDGGDWPVVDFNATLETQPTTKYLEKPTTRRVRSKGPRTPQPLHTADRAVGGHMSFDDEPVRPASVRKTYVMEHEDRSNDVKNTRKRLASPFNFLIKKIVPMPDKRESAELKSANWLIGGFNPTKKEQEGQRHHGKELTPEVVDLTSFSPAAGPSTMDTAAAGGTLAQSSVNRQPQAVLDGSFATQGRPTGVLIELLSDED